MSSITFKTALNTELKHNFYPTDEQHAVNSGLEIEPAASTQEVLRGAGMLFRRTPKGFSVFYKTIFDNTVNEDRAVVEIPDTDLTFVMRLNAADKATFMNCTKLYLGTSPSNITKAYSPEKLVYIYRNASDVLTYDLVDFLRPDLFTFDFKLAGSASAGVTLTHESGSPSVTQTGALPQNGVYSLQFDLRQAKKGKYTMVATGNNAATLTVTFYVDNELFGTDVFGIIKVPFRSNVYAPVSAAVPEYSYTFEAREVKWRYFVVIRSANGLNGNTLSITDTASTYSFAQDGDSPHEDIRINGYDTVVFTSGSYIPFKQDVYTTLRLKNGTEDVFNTGLPNPKKNGVDSDRYGQLTNENILQKHVAEMFVFVDSLT